MHLAQMESSLSRKLATLAQEHAEQMATLAQGQQLLQQQLAALLNERGLEIPPPPPGSPTRSDTLSPTSPRGKHSFKHRRHKGTSAIAAKASAGRERVRGPERSPSNHADDETYAA